MQLNKITDQISLAQSEGDGPLLTDAQSALDLIASIWSAEGGKRLIITKADVAESFFDLKTGFAGEILQKFVNYGFRLAIVGDFSAYTSKSLRDFIYESNKSPFVCFVDTLEDAIVALSR